MKYARINMKQIAQQEYIVINAVVNLQEAIIKQENIKKQFYEEA